MKPYDFFGFFCSSSESWKARWPSIMAMCLAVTQWRHKEHGLLLWGVKKRLEELLETETVPQITAKVWVFLLKEEKQRKPKACGTQLIAAIYYSRRFKTKKSMILFSAKLQFYKVQTWKPSPAVCVKSIKSLRGAQQLVVLGKRSVILVLNRVYS